VNAPPHAWVSCLSFCSAFAFAASAGADPFTFGSLRELIAARNFKSVEELIEALPPDLRSRYTLVFHSRSLQSASPAYPRAILFGADATLVVTFNGDPSEHGYSSVETMAFDPAGSTYQFREISFSGAAGAPGAAGVPGTASISDSNPARCAGCHGRPARPIWDAPPTWPGVYGEHYGAGLSAREAEGMRDFLALQPQHPRYKHLLGAAAFADRETYVTGARVGYNGEKARPPNVRLSELLNALNIRSIMAAVVASPAYEAHRYLLIAAAERGCGELAEFYPKAQRLKVTADLREFERTSAASQRRETAAKASRLASARHGSEGGMSAVSYDELRFVVEHDLGISTRDWTLAAEHNSTDLTPPEDSVTVPQALFNRVAQSDPKLIDLRSYREYSVNDSYCKYLRRASLAALED
jgi:hypothetical protein